MMRYSPLSLSIALAFSGLASQASANDVINPESGVVVGYWHNWCDGAGYQGGNAPCVELEEVNPMYNVVAVSFMKVYDTSAGRIPTFYPDPAVGLSEAEFIAQVQQLNSQGRAVILALGGADAHIELQKGDEYAFAHEVIRLTDLYGFDGLDIDLEQAAVTAKDNQTVIPAALRIVKDHYRQQGKNFLITMAPEFPYLTTNGKYVPYIQNLEGYYDWINPQFYNQGGDGIWSDEHKWLAQNNDEKKEHFIYEMANALSNGSNGFTKIPHNKLVFGIPTNNDAAATGYVKDPQALYNAFDRMADQGQPLRGVMTWSVNWDMGTNSAGQSYDQSFIKAYGPYIHGQESTPVPPPANGVPVLSGVRDARVAQGSFFDPYANVTAMDKEDGDITSSITVDGYVDTQTIGTYALTYTVVDSDGNTTSAVRKVEVYSLPPQFSGVADLTIALGSEFDPLNGVRATDAEDGDITLSILLEGSVNVNLVGQYSLTYTVTDSANQTVSVKRVITVSDGSTCANEWDSSAVYVGGDEVSYSGTTWKAGWWTKGDQPGTTGDWGVWRKVSESECGDQTPPAIELPTISVSGLEQSYVLDQGFASLTFAVETSDSVLVHAKLVKDGNVFEYQSLIADGLTSVTLEPRNLEAGRYQVEVSGNYGDGQVSHPIEAQYFNVDLVDDESLILPTISVSGLEQSYTLENGSINIPFEVNTSDEVLVHAKLIQNGTVYSYSSLIANGTQAVNLDGRNLQPGSYQVEVSGNYGNGQESFPISAQYFNVALKDNSEAPVGSPTAWSSSKVYIKGDVVTHNNREWTAQWWTQGEEPGTTGQWGVWR